VTKRITVHCDETYHCALWRNILLFIVTKHITVHQVFFRYRLKHFRNDRKKNINACQNVRKYRLKTLLWWILIQLWVNDRNVLMAKISQQKWSKCFSEKEKQLCIVMKHTTVDHDETHHYALWRNTSLRIVTKHITVHCDETYHCALWRNMSLCIVTKHVTVHCDETCHCALWGNI